MLPSNCTWSECLTLHEHVNNIYFHCVPDQVLEDLIDHPLEDSSGVFQPEGHYIAVVDGAASGEGRLVLIW